MLIPRFKTGVFPFVDLCPWLKAEGENLTVAVGFLREYMSIMKPLSFDFVGEILLCGSLGFSACVRIPV